MYSLRLFIVALILGSLTPAIAQVHDIKVHYDSLQQQLKVEHKLRWYNTTKQPLKDLVLLDWNHAHHSTQTPLALRLTEEFDRSFFISNKSKFGKTIIHSIQSGKENLQWTRPEEHPDIVRISLNTSIPVGDYQDFSFDYTVQLPSAKFTGHGYKSNGDISLKYWHLMPAPSNIRGWRYYSNLNLEDYGGVENRYQVQWSGMDPSKIISNLMESAPLRYTGDVSAAFFDFLHESDFETYQIKEKQTIITDFESRQRSRISRQASILRISDYFEKVLGLDLPEKLWVQKAMYNRYPFYGLNQLPEIVSPFSEEFHFEVRFLKAFAFAVAEHQLKNLDRRKYYGLFHGLQIYWILKYMEANHPHQKFIGRLAEWKILKPYEISRMPFNRGFWFFNNLTQTTNLQQADRISGDQLTRFNARVGVPYHMGMGWLYLDHYMGGNRLQNSLQALYSSGDLNAFQSFLEQSEQESFKWLFHHYFGDRFSYDLQLAVEKVTADSLQIRVAEKDGFKMPYKLEWVQKNGQTKGKWYGAETMGSSLLIPREKAAYISLNASELWPDRVQKNHWRRNAKSQLKPFRVTFLKDIQSPKANQLFFNPALGLNAYDGFTLGMQFYNKPIVQPNFEFNISPQYSSIEKTLVGNFNLQQRFRKEKSSNYLTLLSVFGSQYHYNESLKYSILVPTVSFLFRPENLRSNYREQLNFAFFQVKRETQSNQGLSSPNYQIFNVSFQQSDRAAINYMNRRIDMDLSKDMGKVYTSLDYRKLFPSGRQFSVRLFGGIFLYHNRQDIQFYDFNLNRPTDYLFRYNYLGRSETEGLLGQQFIPAEGSFKSIIENSSANDFLVSTNLAVGLWKWVEAYADFGILRNRKERARAYYGTGIRLNLLQDYLEIFFPIASSEGLEVNDNQYINNIRIMFTIDPKTLSGLFSRSWF